MIIFALFILRGGCNLSRQMTSTKFELATSHNFLSYKSDVFADVSNQREIFYFVVLRIEKEKRESDI